MAASSIHLLRVCPPPPTPRASRLAAAAAADAPAPGAQLTRLEREARSLVALDVEYAHILVPSGRRLQLVVEVGIVDWRGRPLLLAACNGMDAHGLDPGSRDWDFKGGVRPGEWRDAPPLGALRPAVLAAVGAAPVVGHNIGKDLSALGIEGNVPLERRRDTMRYAALQGPSGLGRSLAGLAASRLGRTIQDTARHDPLEDAVAALELYLRYCHYDTETMGYEDLVEHLTATALRGGRAPGEDWAADELGDA